MTDQCLPFLDLSVHRTHPANLETSKFVVFGDIAMASSASSLTVRAVERYHATLIPYSLNFRLHEKNK